MAGKMNNRQDIIHEVVRVLSKNLPNPQSRQTISKDIDLLHYLMLCLPFLSEKMVYQIIDCFLESFKEDEEFIRNFYRCIFNVLSYKNKYDAIEKLIM